MNEKMIQALSELDWLEALKTASQLKEIAEYMLIHSVMTYDPEKVDTYALLAIEDVEELEALADEINAVFERDDLENSKP